MRYFNFNNSTKNAISRLSFAFSIIACILFTGTALGQAKVTVGSDISATGSMVLEVSGVDDASVSATPVERTSPNGMQLYCAYDIDITKDGREWQPEPEQPAMVSMEGTNFADGQMLDIYHEGANGLEFVATVASENGKITFPAHSFSVYIVAEAADYNRLKVVFHQADGNEVTIWVKKLDLDTYQGAGNFNRIVYNPGMGVAPDGVSCMGWTTNVYYTDEDIPDEMTFDEIRDSIASRLTAGVEDGDDLHFYTMLFKSYSVIYLAEHVVAHTDLILFRSDAVMPHTENYTVNAGYTPADNTHHFDGWLVKDTLSVGSHIEGFTGTDADYERNYPNDTTIRISGDVVFDVNVSEGFWLIYHENGKGATYKAADFVRSGEVTQTPSLTMRRNGYTFDGWWTVAPSEEGGTPTGSLFAFGRALTATTHVYAKWTPRTEAPYSVIIWKQNINGDGYDFERIISLTGTVGYPISTVSSQGTSPNTYARINNTNYQYTGFSLDRFDTGVTINTEGNAVVNVYYNRNQYTLNFQVQDYTYTISTNDNDNNPNKYGLVNGSMARVYWRNNAFRTSDSNNATVYNGTVYTRSNNTSWITVKTITKLYEQSIGDNFPIVGTNVAVTTYNNGERWMPQTTTGQFRDVIVFIEIMPAENNTFRLNTANNTTKTMRYYVETVDGAAGDVTYGGTNYLLYNTIYANLGYIDRTLDWLDLNGYDKYASNPTFPDDGRLSSSINSVDFYYHRKVYSINYMDGAYYDGNGSQLTSVASRGSLGTVSGIAYGANIASYNNETYATVPDGYVFEGWYSDEACTQPYNFTTMPSAGLRVYARWRQIQYRVFLRPNVEASDRSLDWGSDDQEMNFRITYGGSISAPTGIRSEYNFVGWYTDAAFTHPFNEDAVVLNETTVTTPYNKSTDFTDDMDKWGNGATYNKDAVGNNGGDRFWITKKYELFAQWRAKLRGANGINVEYVADADAENLPTDSYLYNDNVKVTAAHACSYSDPNKEFSHWVLQHWNGSEFEDIPTSPRIFPGAAFRVLKSDSKRVIWQWYNPRDPSQIYPGPADPNSFDPEGETPDGYPEFRATYTLRLRAEYITKEKPEHTYIEWFRNDGTVEQIDGESISTPTLGINEAVQPPVPATRTGYNFVGWYRSEDGTGEPVANCDPELLYYNSSDGAFYKESSFTNVANFVAADNYSPRQYLYAIWEPIVEFTLPSVCQGAPVELPLETKYGVDLSATGWSWTASSGTVAGRIFTPSEGESVTLTFNPASSTCAPSTSFPMALKTPNIPNASDYNFIWRGGTASHLTDWNTTSNWFVYSNGDYSIATAMPTRESNIFIGAADCVTSNWPSQTNEANAHNLTIASGASLTVPTDMTLNIAGNLDNTGTLDASDGTVVFCGPSSNGGNQTISHDITFGNVIFYNQGGDIVPSGNVTINGAATFKDGVVKHDVTFGADARVADAGIMTYNSFVEGKVTKNGHARGFTFPTGQNSVLGKIEATSDAEDVSVQYFHNSRGFTESEMPRWWNINDMCSNNNPQLDHVSNFEYWKVETPLALESILTVSAADGNAHFNTTTTTHDADDIYGAFWSGSCWENIGGGSQYVSVDPYGDISVAVKIPQTRTVYDKIVTLGSKDHNTVLPIELTSFSATCDGRSSYLMWTTATEKNNDYFSLEHSDDAINFVEIARIAGAGNSIEPLNYSYIDYGVYGGDNYYRLVQVDYDGTRTASEIIVTNCVETSEEEPEVVAYPNPFNSDLTVELENFGDRPASIEVYDVLGRLVYVEKADAPQNSYQTILHLDGLSNSTYTVRVSTADFVINRKVVKD